MIKHTKIINFDDVTKENIKWYIIGTNIDQK